MDMARRFPRAGEEKFAGYLLLPRCADKLRDYIFEAAEFAGKRLEGLQRQAQRERRATPAQSVKEAIV